MKKTLTLLLLLLSITGFAQKVNLALNLKTDSTYYLITEATLSVIQDIPGQKQTIDMIVSCKVAHKVTAVKDSLYELQVSYTDMSIHMSVGGRTIDMSSNGKTGDNVPSKLLANILNRPFSMVISKHGKVISLSGFENVYAHMADNMPQITEAQLAQFKTQMQQSFSEKSIKGNFQDAFAMFPYKAAGVGDQWTAYSSIESVMSATTKTTYTLKSIANNVYIIHGDATVISESNTDYKPINGLMMRYTNITGGVVADIKIDKNTCWINEAKTSKTIKGTADIKDSEKTPGGLVFPMSIIGDFTVTGK
ncbi:hypothetical protein KXD93_29805 [Mucilaginibacter sp. BJC16-A38]|uniref:DUF6263 family protein n=1 Tax=Mucilaginibacter phenanthrenivorans TaxID=1234842 RepID=UPI002158269B|nr:DUF6263 family protein [Mucilaginibacter phenanthrenivorans]MCR8561888.1 hypothetical protein [Mucilaginibacter phenanthrenivorans]